MKKIEVGGFGQEVRISSAFDVYLCTGAMTMNMLPEQAIALAEALKEAAASAKKYTAKVEKSSS